MIDIYPIDGPWPGRLSLCGRPRAGTFLEDDIRNLKHSGHDILVSALTPQERDRLGLQGVAEACARQGLEFVNFPIGNLMVPRLEETVEVLYGWSRALAAGRGIAIHCWATVGRSPTLAAALLVLAGHEPGDAWSHVESRRGREVPDTHEQRRWVERLIEHRLRCSDVTPPVDARALDRR